MANTTSSSYSFDQDFSIDEIIADAYERLGLVGTAGHQIKTAKRSLNILFQEWGNRGIHFWEVGNTNVNLEGEIEGLQKDFLTMTGEMKKQKGRAASAHTQRGQLLEKWCPFLEHPDIDPKWEAKDWSFLGQPIDYLVFNWYDNKEKNLEEGVVVMLDVKSGKSGLTTKQRRIRDLVKAGKVEWREIRLD